MTDKDNLLELICDQIAIVTKKRCPKCIIDASDFKNHKERVEALAELASKDGVAKYYTYPLTLPANVGIIWIASEIQMTEEERQKVIERIKSI